MLMPGGAQRSRLTVFVASRRPGKRSATGQTDEAKQASNWHVKIHTEQ